MLKEHINYIQQIDHHFSEFWATLEDNGRAQFFDLAKRIEASSNLTGEPLLAQHRIANSLLKRKLIVVQQLEFQHHRLPKDWGLFVRDDEAKQKCFDQSQQALARFALRFNSSSGIIRFYGNIKPSKSLERKILFRAVFGTAAQKNEMDARDIVRFRFVVSGPDELVNVSVALWRENYDYILGCHNFYFYPKAGDSDDHYRAIHFQIETIPNRFVELQVMTRAREVITFLDHALLFKKGSQFLNRPHERWLKDLQLKANIYDAHFLSEGIGT